VGSNLVSSYIKWKWCQSHARSIKVYAILVHSTIEKRKKIEIAKWGNSKKNI